MKTIIVSDYADNNLADIEVFDLTKMQAKDCIGCWTCWRKTPGRCAFKDLDNFYHKYITADKVIFFSKIHKGFISGNLKSLFDRMIPLYLPYTTYKTGESMHVPRYEKYPDIEFYFNEDFQSPQDQQIYADYITRVFYQFHSKNIVVKPITELDRNKEVK